MDMDIRKYGQKPFVFAAPFAFLLFFMFVCLAAAFNPLWGTSSHNLSHLGVGDNRLSVWLYNSGCFISGILMSLYGVGKYIFEEGLHKRAGIFIIIAGIGLFLEGIATGDYEPAHSIATAILLVPAGIGIVLATISDIRDGNRLVLYSAIILLVLLIIQWPFFFGATSEIMPIIAASFWSLVQLYKYFNDEPLTPLESSVDVVSPVSACK